MFNVSPFKKKIIYLLQWKPLKNNEKRFLFHLKDTHRKNAPSNKTPALRKNTNMGVWAVGTLNQLFIRGS